MKPLSARLPIKTNHAVTMWVSKTWPVLGKKNTDTLVVIFINN